MAIPRLIVLEFSGQWASALRWLLHERGISVSEVESLESCLAMLEQNSTSIAAVEASDSNLESALAAVGRLHQDSRGCGVIVLADRGLQVMEPMFFEAGAMFVVTSRRHLGSVVKLIQRRLQIEAAPGTTYREETWRRMPWGQR